MALSQNWGNISRSLGQSYVELTNETNLDDYTFKDFGNISWTDLESIKWNSAGTRKLKINYDDISRTSLSQNWGNVAR